MATIGLSLGNVSSQPSQAQSRVSGQERANEPVVSSHGPSLDQGDDMI